MHPERPAAPPRTPPEALVADFLRTDVQDYPPLIAAIAAGLRRPGETVLRGNLFELRLSATTVVITPRNGQPVPIARAAFAEAFQAWCAER